MTLTITPDELVSTPRGQIVQKFGLRPSTDGLEAALRDIGIIVRCIDAREARTLPSFFESLSKAMEFADYYGHNWDGSNDLMRDLGWLLPCRGFALVICNASEFLQRASSDEQDQFMDFATLITSYWADGRTPENPFGEDLHLPFHFVFTDPRPGSNLLRRISNQNRSLIQEMSGS